LFFPVDNISLRVPSRKMRNCSASCSMQHRRNAESATAVYLVRSDIDVFSKEIRSLA